MNALTKTLQPTPVRNAGVVDLLDRLLVKGLMLNADVLVTVAGVPLLGLKLRLLLAGVSTMLRYGMMQDWEAAQRAAARLPRRHGRVAAGFHGSSGARSSLLHPARPADPAGTPVWEAPDVLWYLYPEGAARSSWRLGPVSVRDGGWHWQAGPEEPAAFSLFPKAVRHCYIDNRVPGMGPRGQPVLEIHYMGSWRGEKACFSGPVERLHFWAQVLTESRHDALETCPACQAPAPAGRLMSQGCRRCGWRGGAGGGASRNPKAYAD